MSFLLQVALGGLGGVGHLVELLFYLLQLAGHLLLARIVEPLAGQLVLELLHFVGRLLEIATLERLGQLVGRPASHLV